MIRGNRRRSGLQSDVLALYRKVLRAAKLKDDPATLAYAKSKFHEDAASVKRSEFNKIEFLLRQGHKRLKTLSMPGTKAVNVSTNPMMPSSRAYSTNTSTSAMATTMRARSFFSSPLTNNKEALSAKSDGGSSSSMWSQPERPRAHIVSLGCGRNWVDSEVMLGDFLRAGYEIEASDENRASLLVVNTCGFLGAAREEGDEVIRRLADVKTQRLAQGQDCVLVVTGCMVNLDKEAVLKRHPTVDHLVGGGAIGKVLKSVESGQQLVDLPLAAKSRKTMTSSAAAAVADSSLNSMGDENKPKEASTAPLLSHLEEDVHKSNKSATNDEEEAHLSALRASLAAGEAPLVGARLLATPRHLAYLKIAEGCRKRCSFCVIPLIKGALRSKPIDQVVREFRALRAGGVQEVSLIAQDLGDFGKDFGTGVSEIEVEKGEEVGGTSLSTLEADASPPVEGTPQLIKLLDHILASETASPGGSSSSPSDTQQHQQQQQPHVLPSYWLRLLYLYPDEITPQLLHVMASSQGRIAPYIDMPIQHVNDGILLKMGRKVKYNRAALESTLTAIHNLPVPRVVDVNGDDVLLAPWEHVTIRTTLMVGFPGETERGFLELLNFVQEWGPQHLHHIGVFEFSPEPQAKATHMPNQVSSKVKKRRRLQLEAAHSRNVRARNRELLGKKILVLVDKVSDSGESAVARHSGQALAVDGCVMLTGWDLWEGLSKGGGGASGNMPPLRPPAPSEWWVVEVFDADNESGNLVATPLKRLVAPDSARKVVK